MKVRDLLVPDAVPLRYVLYPLCPSFILHLQDCVGEMLWCDTEAGECKYGCDEQEDCPDGKICVIANHACQC